MLGITLNALRCVLVLRPVLHTGDDMAWVCGTVDYKAIITPSVSGRCITYYLYILTVIRGRGFNELQLAWMSWEIMQASN